MWKIPFSLCPAKLVGGSSKTLEARHKNPQSGAGGREGGRHRAPTIWAGVLLESACLFIDSLPRYHLSHPQYPLNYIWIQFFLQAFAQTAACILLHLQSPNTPILWYMFKPVQWVLRGDKKQGHLISCASCIEFGQFRELHWILLSLSVKLSSLSSVCWIKLLWVAWAALSWFSWIQTTDPEWPLR